MSDAKSNYLESKIIKHVLKNTAYTSPTTVYLALYTSNPGETDSGTEVTGGSYARQTIAFGAESGGSVSNSGTITFTGVPAATITHFGLRDDVSAGNLLYYGALTASVVTTAGSVVTFNAGTITVSET